MAQRAAKSDPYEAAAQWLRRQLAERQIAREAYTDQASRAVHDFGTALLELHLTCVLAARDTQRSLRKVFSPLGNLKDLE